VESMEVTLPMGTKMNVFCGEASGERARTIHVGARRERNLWPAAKSTSAQQ
jgi:hypothetical protein